MFDLGRHDRHTQQHQRARYHLRQGMARVALDHKTGRRPALDCAGNPMRAVEMAERHSVKTLQRWADGHSAIAPGKASKVWCSVCRKAQRDPWHEPPVCDA